jgi:uncharacterized protein YqjF (DUF2071 family)
MRKLLTARWSDLIMINYEVDPAVLADRVPVGTELDLYEGRCYVSLVGFMFLDTRVLEFLIPGHINFEEVNLRFYVKRDTPDEMRRGVVFIREIVPKSAIAFIARVLYGEPYERWNMCNSRNVHQVSYAWDRDGSKNKISVERGSILGVPAAGSFSEFIIEHYWGYTRRRETRTDEYRVEHPKWELYNVHGRRINVDFGGTYGEAFAFLSGAIPHSVLLAGGSEVSVFKGEVISS